MKKSQITPENKKTSGSLFCLLQVSKGANYGKHKKIVASDLFVKSAHFFAGFGPSFAFFFWLGLKDCNATKRMICFHKLKRKEQRRKKTWGEKSDSGDQRLMT